MQAEINHNLATHLEKESVSEFPNITIARCQKKLWEYVRCNNIPMIIAFLKNENIKNICGSEGWGHILNDSINEDGDTLLIWACFGGHEAIVRSLLEDPAVDLYKADKYGFTAQVSARHAGRAYIARLLESAIANNPQSSETNPAQSLCFEDDAGKDNFDQWLSGLIKPSMPNAYKKLG